MGHADDLLGVMELQSRYGAGIDRCDVDVVASCFAEDAVADYGSAGHLEGRQAIAARLVERAGLNEACTHFIGLPRITVDGERVLAETPCVAYLLAPGGGSVPLRVRGVRYLDELVRGDGGWLIAYRRHGADWQFDASGDGRVGDAPGRLPWPWLGR